MVPTDRWRWRLKDQLLLVLLQLALELLLKLSLLMLFLVPLRAERFPRTSHHRRRDWRLRCDAHPTASLCICICRSCTSASSAFAVAADMMSTWR